MGVQQRGFVRLHNLFPPPSPLSRGGIEREAAAMLGAAAADVFRPFVRQASERDGETESATEVGGSRRELESKRACDGELFEAVLCSHNTVSQNRIHSQGKDGHKNGEGEKKHGHTREVPVILH